MPPRSLPWPDGPADRLAALERSNRNLSTLLRSAPFPVLLLDQQLRVADFSAPLADVGRIDGRGSALAAVEWGLDMDWLPDAARRAMDGGDGVERVVEAQAGDGRYAVHLLPWEGAAGPGLAVAFRPLHRTAGAIDERRYRDAIAGVQAIRHQLSNTMLLMRSLVRRSADTADSLEDYVLHLEARLDSIYGTLAALVREPGKVFDLGEMIIEELDEQGAFPGDRARTLGGPRTAVRASAAQVLGLAFQELVTNAVQHGGGGDGGRLDVAWRIAEAEGQPSLRLDWTEHGRVAPPRRAAFSAMILESVLPYQLDGRATRDFGPDSLRVTMVIPMTNLAAEEGEAFGLF